MKEYLKVKFFENYMFNRILRAFTCTWVRVTENKVVFQLIDNSIREYKLKNISELEITTLY